MTTTQLLSRLAGNGRPCDICKVRVCTHRLLHGIYSGGFLVCASCLPALVERQVAMARASSKNKLGPGDPYAHITVYALEKPGERGLGDIVARITVKPRAA